MLKNGILMLVLYFSLTLNVAQATTACHFQYAYAGTKIGDVYNGPLLCRNVTLDTLKVEGTTRLNNSRITKQLHVRGDVYLYHTYLKVGVIEGTVDGKDCIVKGLLTIYGNQASFENCSLNDITVYADNISAFPPTISLIKTKVHGKIHFYNRQGKIISH